MLTKEKLTQALYSAMKARDNQKKATIRLALAAIKNAEIEAGGDIDEKRVLGILHKEVKLRREAIEEALIANRPDLKAASQEEIEIIEQFLPKPLSQSEINELVNQAIADAGAATPRDMGNVMKILIPQVMGRADGRILSDLVRKKLIQS